MDGMMMMAQGTPWLDQPLMLIGDRSHKCKLSEDQCAWQFSWWRNWYEADYAYGLPPIYFFAAVIGLFTFLRFSMRFRPNVLANTTIWIKGLALSRFIAYRGFAVRKIAWYSPSLGVLILGVMGMVFFLGLTLGPQPYYWPQLDGDKSFGDSMPIATRSGWLAAGIMPFLVMVSMKLNLITQLTGISHERLQVFHRWMAYAMLVLALVHTFPFIVNNINQGEMVMNWQTSIFYWTGVVALLAQAYLTLFSFKMLRDRFYEIFKATHLTAAVLFVVFFFLHCDHTLTSWLFFIATAAVYFVPFFCQQLRTFYEYGFGLKAYVTQEANNTVTVRVPLESWWKPGQHMFLRFVSLKLGVHCLTAHPFTICSLPESREAMFQIKIKGGVTKRLAAVARKYPNVPISVWIDGPYGGMQEEQLTGYDRQLIIAGGSGAGFTLPLIEQGLKQKWRPQLDDAAGEKAGLIDVATKSRISVVLVTRQPETERWFRREIAHLLERYSPGLDGCPIDVRIHTTHGFSASNSLASSISEVEDAETQTAKADKTTLDAEPTSTMQDDHECISSYSGRPDLRVLVRDMTSSHNEASVGIAVCGPSSMTYDVRNAAADAELRALQGKGSASNVYLHVECFGW